MSPFDHDPLSVLHGGDLPVSPTRSSPRACAGDSSRPCHCPLERKESS